MKRRTFLAGALAAGAAYAFRPVGLTKSAAAAAGSGDVAVADVREGEDIFGYQLTSRAASCRCSSAAMAAAFACAMESSMVSGPVAAPATNTPLRLVSPVAE